MTKANYRAWHINPENFPNQGSDVDKLLFFARYAILAPSGHNTQPWQFHRSEKSLLLTINSNRTLPHSGKLASEPYISLGNCIEVLILAAKGFGYEISLDYILKGDKIVSFSIKGTTEAQPSLLEAIVKRRSNRSFYVEEDVAEEALYKIIINDFKDISTSVIKDKKDIKYLAEQTKHATRVIMHEPEFRNELSGWVRNNLSKQHDGMPGFVQGMPTPPSMLAKQIVKRIDISKSQAKIDSNRLLHTSVIIILQIDKHGPLTFINAGRMYARVCVNAQVQGFATTGIGAAVIDPTTKASVAKNLGLPGEPVALIRLGHPTKLTRHTPRWPIEKVTV